MDQNRESDKEKSSRSLSHSGLPPELKNKIEELSKGKVDAGEILVIQKALYFRDVDPGRGSFCIPSDQIRNRNFLKDDEMAHLKSRDRTGKDLNSLPVPCVEPNLKDSLVFLKIWDTGNQQVSGEDSMSYFLTKSWKKILSGNKLEEGQIVQLWALRVRGDLWFCLRNLTENASDSDCEK